MTIIYLQWQDQRCENESSNFVHSNLYEKKKNCTLEDDGY